MQRGYAHRHGILTAYISFPKALMENKTTTASIPQGQGHLKGNTKVKELKGKGHFFIRQKGTMSTIYDLSVTLCSKMAFKSIKLLTKFNKY